MTVLGLGLAAVVLIFDFGGLRSSIEGAFGINQGSLSQSEACSKELATRQGPGSTPGSLETAAAKVDDIGPADPTLRYAFDSLSKAYRLLARAQRAGGSVEADEFKVGGEQTTINSLCGR